jgi:hypothetical protein
MGTMRSKSKKSLSFSSFPIYFSMMRGKADSDMTSVLQQWLGIRGLLFFKKFQGVKAAVKEGVQVNNLRLAFIPLEFSPQTVCRRIEIIRHFFSVFPAIVRIKKSVDGFQNHERKTSRFGNRAVWLPASFHLFREFADVVDIAAYFGVIPVHVTAFCFLPDSVNTDFNFAAVIHEKERGVIAVNETDTLSGAVIHKEPPVG